MSLLADTLSAVADEEGITRLADGFNARADALFRDGSPEAAAWGNVFSVLSIETESALLARRTSIPIDLKTLRRVFGSQPG
jgi:hypothetical protein